jgi:hypothetical protein
MKKLMVLTSLISLLIACTSENNKGQELVDSTLIKEQEQNNSTKTIIQPKSDPDKYLYDKDALKELISYNGSLSVKSDFIEELTVDEQGNFYVSSFHFMPRQEILDEIERKVELRKTCSYCSVNISSATERRSLKGRIVGITYDPFDRSKYEYSTKAAIFLELTDVVYTKTVTSFNHTWDYDNNTVLDQIDENNSYTVHSIEEEFEYYHKRGNDNIIISEGDGSKVCKFAIVRPHSKLQGRMFLGFAKHAGFSQAFELRRYYQGTDNFR